MSLLDRAKQAAENAAKALGHEGPFEWDEDDTRWDDNWRTRLIINNQLSFSCGFNGLAVMHTTSDITIGGGKVTDA